MRSVDWKRRGRGSEGIRGAGGKECEECTQIQGTLTHNHGNQALNFNPSCSRCHGYLSIRTLPPHTIPSSGLSLSHLTRAPEKAVIIRSSEASAGSSPPWRQHLHSVWWRSQSWRPLFICFGRFCLHLTSQDDTRLVQRVFPHLFLNIKLLTHFDIMQFVWVFAKQPN